MESIPYKAPGSGHPAGAVMVEEDDSHELGTLGIEQYITSDVVRGLLGIPEEGLLRISAALLIAGNNDVCAYWWRDPHDGGQHVEFRDPVLVKAGLSDVMVDSGYLPQNVIRLGIGSGVRWIAVCVPPTRYELVFSYAAEKEADQTISVTLPGCVLAGRGGAYWMWAVKGGYPTPQSPLYRMPLPNIGGDGALCFGVNTPPKADTSTITQVLHLFMDSKFNNHWSEGKAWSQPGDIRQLLCAIAKQEQPIFPEEDLVPMTQIHAPEREITLDYVLTLVKNRRV